MSETSSATSVTIAIAAQIEDQARSLVEAAGFDPSTSSVVFGRAALFQRCLAARVVPVGRSQNWLTRAINTYIDSEELACLSTGPTRHTWEWTGARYSGHGEPIEISNGFDVERCRAAAHAISDLLLSRGHDPGRGRYSISTLGMNRLMVDAGVFDPSTSLKQTTINIKRLMHMAPLAPLSVDPDRSDGRRWLWTGASDESPSMPKAKIDVPGAP